MSEPVKQKDEATVQVPAKGLGTPGEGLEPQMPPGPNPELADDRKLVEMVSTPSVAAQTRDGRQLQTLCRRDFLLRTGDAPMALAGGR
jgi:hypothetical protein